MRTSRIECTVLRNKSGLSRKIHPRYELIYAHSNKFILAAQKINTVGSAHYIITMDPSNMNKNTTGYLGKVRSNNAGTEYNLFSGGENPSTTQILEFVRAQLAAVQYVSLRKNKKIGTIRFRYHATTKNECINSCNSQ